MDNTFHHVSKVAEALTLQRLVDETADLKERVGDERFYVACLGEFKRGKSTLLNALCNAPLLPTGILPVTAVPTIIRFGKELVVRVRLSAGDWQQIAPEQLTDYVSENQNPGNHKQVQAVEVFCPAPLLTSGLCLVDTPGIGSIFDSNTIATHAFVPQIDAALILIGVDPPITGDELSLAVQVAASARELILVLTKADRFTTAERTEASAFARSALEERLDRKLGAVIEVSATEFLAGNGPTRDWQRLINTLSTLGANAGRELSRNAGTRGVQRITNALLDEISRRLRFLTQPIAATEQEVLRLNQLMTAASRKAFELGYSFSAEEGRLHSLFLTQRETFVQHARTGAVAEMTSRSSGIQAHFGPDIRRQTVAIARDIARRTVEPWLNDERARAERSYIEVATRFVDEANNFLRQLTTVAETRTGAEDRASEILLEQLPQEIGSVHGFTIPSRYFFRALEPLVSQTPMGWMHDVISPRQRLLLRVQRDSANYLADLLNMNSTLVANDLDDRVVESRRLLEGKIAGLLRDVSSNAEHAYQLARSLHARGTLAVEAAIRELHLLREELVTPTSSATASGE